MKSWLAKHTRGARWAPLLFVASALILVGATNWWVYHRIEGALDQNLGTRLKSIVRTLMATSTIRGDAILGEEGGFDDLEISFIDPILRRIQEENALDAILLLDPIDYHVGYSSSDLYVKGSLYPYLETHSVAIVEAVTEYNVTVSPTIPVGSLYLKSGFAPVVTLLGDEQVVGILVVEASADFFGILNTVRNVMFSGIMAAGILLLLLVITYLGLQRQIRLAQRALEREDRMAALGRMASQVAHEIRNPVGVIKYSAERMAKWLDNQGGGRRQPDPVLLEMVSYIEEETGRLHDLTERYLTYTRQGEVRFQRIDPGKLIESTIVALERIEPPEGIELKSHVEDGLPSFQGDPDLLRQVLLNLCTNALEAMGTNGKLTLFAHHVDSVIHTGGMESSSAGTGDSILLGVEDTGPGIPENMRERIFEPFFSTRDDGNGLGLYIVEGIVRSHDGEVIVETAGEGGARVFLRLPADDGGRAL